MTQISQTTQQTAASSEELAATAHEMSGQAEQLQSSMAFFTLAGGHSGAAPKKAPKPIAGPRAKERAGGAVRPSGAAVAGDIALATLAAAVPDETQFGRF
jgi:hypothetical protein